MIFELVKDFAAVLDAMPVEHPRRRILKLLDEAIRRDIHFADRHPSMLFQSLWNIGHCGDSCGFSGHSTAADPQLRTLMDKWRTSREQCFPGCCWLRTMRPPPTPLGGSLEAVFRPGGAINAVAFTADDQRLLVAGPTNEVRVLESQRGLELHKLCGHKDEVTCIAVSAVKGLVATGGRDGTVRLWEIDSGAELERWDEFLDSVRTVVFTVDGSLLAAGSDDRSIRVWNLESRSERCVMLDEGKVLSLAFSLDGNQLYSGSNQNQVTAWDSSCGVAKWFRRGHSQRLMGSVGALAVSPDGCYLASGSGDEIYVEFLAEQQGFVIDSRPANVECLTFYGPKFLLFGTDRDDVCAYDLTEHRITRRFQGHEGVVRAVSVSSDGSRIASASEDGTVRTWRTEAPDSRPSDNHEARITCVVAAPDGCSLATSSRDGTVRLWNAATGSLVLDLRFTAEEDWEKSIEQIAFSSDSSLLAGICGDHKVRVWDVQSGVEVARSSKFEHLGPGLAFSPDSSRLYIAVHEKVEVWHIRTRRVICSLEGHDDIVWGIAISADDTRVAAGSQSLTGTPTPVLVWDEASGKELYRLEGHGHTVGRIAFSPDGDYVIAECSWANETRVWRLSDQECVAVIERAFDPRILAQGSVNYGAYRGNGETVLMHLESARPAAWVPTELSHLVEVNAGCIAGSSGANLYLYRIEG